MPTDLQEPRTIDVDEVGIGTLSRLTEEGVTNRVVLRVTVDGDRVDLAMVPAVAREVARQLKIEAAEQ